MDRGENRDLLSSGFFDGSHDHLYYKRMIANDSSRKRATKRERVSEGGEILLPFSCIQPYRCHVPQTKTRLVCHLNPETDNFTNKNHSVKFKGEI